MLNKQPLTRHCFTFSSKKKKKELLMKSIILSKVFFSFSALFESFIYFLIQTRLSSCSFIYSFMLNSLTLPL